MYCTNTYLQNGLKSCQTFIISCNKNVTKSRNFLHDCANNICIPMQYELL